MLVNMQLLRNVSQPVPDAVCYIVETPTYQRLSNLEEERPRRRLIA